MAVIVGYFCFVIGDFGPRCLSFDFTPGLFRLNNLLLYDDQVINIIYPETYLEMIWLYYCKIIIFTITGHVVMYQLGIMYMIKLPNLQRNKMNVTVKSAFIFIRAYYLFNISRMQFIYFNFT